MKNKIVRLSTLAVVSFLIFIYELMETVLTDGITVYEPDHQTMTDQMKTGDVYEETIVPSQTLSVELKGIQIPFVNYGNEIQSGTIEIFVSGRDGVISKNELNLSEIIEWRWENIRFNETYHCAPREEISIRLEAKDIGADSTISIAESSTGNIALKMVQSNLDRFEKLFIIFSIISAIIVVLAYISIVRFAVPLEYVFLYTIVPIMLMISILIPVYSAPDEVGHISVAFWYQKGQDGKVSISDAEINTGLQEIGADHAYYDWYFEQLTAIDNDAVMVDVPGSNWEENPRFFYFMNGMGLRLGRMIHLSGAGIAMMARLFGMIPVVWLLFYAIKRAKTFKTAFFILCSLPMVEMLSAVVNPDGIIIAMSLALLSCVLSQTTRVYQMRRLDYLDLAVIAVCSLILATAKYGALIPLCLIPLMLVSFNKRNKLCMENAVSFGAVLIPIFSVFGIFIPSILGTVHKERNVVGTWSRFYSVGDVVHHPFRVFEIYMNTLYNSGSNFFTQALGMRLGSMDVYIPELIVIALFVLLMFAILSENNGSNISHPKKWFLATIALLGVLCAMGGMLIGWTARGRDAIEGLQGRYFIPFLMPFLIALSPEHAWVDENGIFKRKLAFASVWLQFLVIMSLFIRA